MMPAVSCILTNWYGCCGSCQATRRGGPTTASACRLHHWIQNEVLFLFILCLPLLHLLLVTRQHLEWWRRIHRSQKQCLHILCMFESVPCECMACTPLSKSVSNLLMTEGSSGKSLWYSTLCKSVQHNSMTVTRCAPCKHSYTLLNSPCGAGTDRHREGVLCAPSQTRPEAPLCAHRSRAAELCILERRLKVFPALAGAGRCASWLPLALRGDPLL